MPYRQHSGEDDPMIGRVFANRYEIRARIGSGGMAVVYASHDKMLMRDVAVKILRPEALNDPTAGKRLEREATAAGQLHHPHIITFHDVGVADEYLFIVMELLRGMTIADTRREAGGKLPVLRVAEIGAQVASALQCVHDANIIHRDLKPENVFLLDRGTTDYAKLLDFSIAKLPEELVDGRLTQTGTVFGTPYYMAPEQALGDAVSFQTDLYSFGSMLFEMVAGRAPFQADNAIKLLTKVTMETAPTLSSLGVKVPRPFEALVASMLDKAAWHRPATASDVQTALRKVVEVGDDGNSPSTGRARTQKKRKRTDAADKTMQGQFSDDGVGDPVRAPNAVYSRISDTDQLSKPAAQQLKRPAKTSSKQPRRERRATQPRSVGGDTPSAEQERVSLPNVPESRKTTPIPASSSGRRKRATMPRWNTDQRLAIKEDPAIDEDDTL